MTTHSTSPSTPRGTLLFEGELTDPLVVALPDGEAALLSRPHPFRTPNQDTAAVLPSGKNGGLLVVADGMGGTRHGGAAAAITIRHLAKHLPTDSEEPLRTGILNGIESANQHLLDKLPDAGATVAAVELEAGTIRPYHVGDSVIMVIGQRGKLKLQTVAHSPVGLAEASGLLNETEALHHHERHIISNAIGSPEMRIELGAPLPLSRFDTVLLASDGLTDNLRLDEIIALIRTGPLAHGVALLADAADERMRHHLPGQPNKPDDLTILAYRRTS